MAFSAEEQQWIDKLKSPEYNQGHLFKEGAAPEQIKRLLADVKKADAAYPGGLINYIKNARKLLIDSKNGVNPFEGCTPVVPEGESPAFGTPAYASLEQIGMDHLDECCFCLVAGGLGERLGYPGIKIGLPSETSTNTTYIELYIKYLLAYQAYACQKTGKDIKVPLAIMTSGDTHQQTVELLAANNNFGMVPGQITIMLQQKVPALLDNDARMAVNEKDPFQLETKPHGHGDVHTLLSQYGMTSKWLSEGKKWLLFFQDTNGIIFRAFPAILGVSVSRGFAMNSVTVPRKPGEAVGGICKLAKADGSAVTVNVEYNQLDPLLKTTGDKKGDVPDASGNSKFPGNINVLLFALPRYHEVLSATGGTVPEFVNPKYKDAEKSLFKSPTRLECMMQDFPRLLSTADKVGFTQLERWLCFSTVKNAVADAAVKAKQGLAPEAAFSGEAEAYSNAAKLIALAGKSAGAEVSIGKGKTVSFLDVPSMLGAMVVALPSFGITLEDMKRRFGKGKITVSDRSTLILEGDVHIDGLELDGTLVLKAAPGSKLCVKNLKVNNKGWELVPLQDASKAPPKLQIRGYDVARHEACEQIAGVNWPGMRVVA